jgi:FdhD protein
MRPIVVHCRPVQLAPPLIDGLPRLSAAEALPTREIEVVDASGARRRVAIPEERALTVYVDKRELVTLMTLGRHPELLVLGYLLNQRLVDAPREIESVQVDWAVGAAVVRTHAGLARIEERTARRVVTTGCGQGTVFGDVMAGAESATLPPPSRSRIELAALAAIGDAMRSQPSIYREAGSVHGTALWRLAGEPEQRFFVEDVGRHNAVDTIAGWMAMQGESGADKLLYTTGRLTSEMVMKAARLGVPVLVSRNGVTAMGHALAERIGMTLCGRASGQRLLCYTGAERLAGFEAGS